jgi:CheY-specific phosphatase CheX
MSDKAPHTVQGTDDLLVSLCNSVTRVLNVASTCNVQYSGMVQRIKKTYLKPDIGCFVLFDGGFSGLVIINFSAASAMELYRSYLLNMGMSESDLASSHTSDEVSNVMGELMNQVVGDFTGKIRRELQTHITQNQPKMLVLNKQVQLSVDANFDANEVVDPDAIIAQAAPNHAPSNTAAVSQQTTADSETEALLKSLGM